MKTENWKKVKELLQEVLPLDLPERKNFLENSGVSAEIRREVESLLAFEEESEDLMRLTAVEFSKDFFDADGDGKNRLIGQKIGVYEIVGELGQGGMGAVYLAERTDGKFKQKVALKLLKREMNTVALRAHFRQEREILASLEHPNIARLLDAGTTDDHVPFIAMEYVEGLPIDDYCNRHDLDLTDRLNLFRTVCSIVNFAHRNLIVHRDLKPSNILVTFDGSPKLLDFGISKILSTETENTATITKLGVMTPGYASPEQLRGESVTTATDIYSLGVILYELLSGHRPFETKENDRREIYRAVIEIEPERPSSVVISDFGFGIADLKKTASAADNRQRTADNRLKTNPKSQIPNPKSLKGDLDNIVLKALKKEPERRYSSAENFSEDIRRHLEGLPVTARPDTFAYRAEKFIKRNSLSVLAGALILLAIVGGVAATLWQARIAQAERARAEKRFNDVRTLANSF
nr:serine/threonine protein kinase [Acidobacteriota bacterium]